MIAAPELQEYLEEIRDQVCSRCVEKPAGGPPCAPLGKDCGVELHLPQLIESIRQVRSPLIDPYLERNRNEICAHCSFLRSSICPCPMDYLAVLLVQAVETVDEQRRKRGDNSNTNRDDPDGIAIEEIRTAYREAAGSWTGCDWPTSVGKTHLNLKGCVEAWARTMAMRTAGQEAGKDWELGAAWLAKVEDHARRAEVKAAAALRAAEDGRWREAVAHAECACALEFATGRAIWRDGPLAWQTFCQLLQNACVAQENSSRVATLPSPEHL
ncbi:MAG: hypothetical protein L0Y72_06695 [Gemmataceae bacterium]|nr:hypothetical protein [Gemmataceae bacterium]